jgi:glutamate N-acetyltransferase/amino-acid N-acetyltransferase
MTTDTHPKACAVELNVGGTTCRIGGMAKGAGMIHPHMATMLGFITTDAALPAELLQEALRRAAKVTFNRITVDGDTSTNDSVLLLANGRSGAKVEPGSAALEDFQEGLCQVMGELARSIARDGEGATKLIEITVEGARTEEDADRAARAIANSPLVKCAMHGGDPNWGRIVCAAGYSGAEFGPENVALRLGTITVFEEGLPTGEDAAHQLEGDDIKIHLDLGAGPGAATIWTCDLSKEYVEINAEYHT